MTRLLELLELLAIITAIFAVVIGLPLLFFWSIGPT
jgi:hypothetical protein